jgi:hypothetical protein
MSTQRSVSTGVKTSGIVLIVFIGLFNFHIPHFLIESHKYSFASYMLELALLGNVLGAITAAGGIYRNKRWGWILGILIACISVALWIAQETIGLPGLPKMWFEPSRIVSLSIEALFVIVAYRQLRSTEFRHR